MCLRNLNLWVERKHVGCDKRPEGDNDDDAESHQLHEELCRGHLGWGGDTVGWSWGTQSLLSRHDLIFLSLFFPLNSEQVFVTFPPQFRGWVFVTSVLEFCNLSPLIHKVTLSPSHLV